ncbi:uncharacterized protein LOC126559039 [Anopheles maculipalpis]|uniref:uncharacterized protein LOC126559039 n=1 Tax=Anopheles maculipalpis TaxID=1496333 RepID=UPI002159AE63|nr:uncharacterized protein LOC126559039 [Anopheles maculipalpis]
MEDSRYLMNQTELLATHQDELKQELLKYYRTSLIISVLKQSDAPISVEHRALLSMYKHDGDLPLGLDHIRNVDISYHERIAIGKYIEAKITEQVRPFLEKAKRFSGGELAELSVTQFQEHYKNLQLDQERQELTDKLAQLKVRKLQLMKACAEIRTGPYQRNNVELKHAEARTMQHKTELFQKLIANEIANCTPHAVKAIKEVAANINTLLGNDSK